MNMPPSKEQSGWLRPPFDGDSAELAICLRYAQAMQANDPRTPEGVCALDNLRTAALAEAERCRGKQQVRVIISVLFDLRSQGWMFVVDNGQVRISRPEQIVDEQQAKAHIRVGHAVEREAQLRKPSVRKFVRQMEEPRLFGEQWVSIFSLMRDGRDLAAGLACLRQTANGAGSSPSVQQSLDPYIQVIRGPEKCEHTGLRLMDVWRYFRYTWVTAYQSVPGRCMMVLIRDRAAKHHPVIGIAALASPVVQLHTRDEWIGWAPGQLSARLEEKPRAAWAKWSTVAVRSLIRDIHVADLIGDGLLSKMEINNPTAKCIAALRAEAARARAAHQKYPNKRVHKTPKDGGSTREWQVRALTHLFRSKRAGTLADLLWIRMTLSALAGRSSGRTWLKRVLASADGRKAVEAIRRYVKAIHVGNDLLEIAICGAIPPYNSIFGGKLVAMLLTSPEVVNAYRARYSSTSSIIASSMAGRAIRRKPRLVAMATTSLYGRKLSQYTRISIPAQACGGKASETVCYRELGMTEGQGSYHLSGQTIDEIGLLLAQTEHGRRVNSIFGEGVNPRMRKIRGGLDMCGFPSDHVLKHGNARVVYGVGLASNFREVLMGQAKRPRYILPKDQPEAVTQAIADYWFLRWLQPRLGKDGMIEEVSRDILARPITHRAKVVLPEVDGEAPLFEQGANQT